MLSEEWLAAISEAMRECFDPLVIELKAQGQSELIHDVVICHELFSQREYPGALEASVAVSSQALAHRGGRGLVKATEDPARAMHALDLGFIFSRPDDMGPLYGLISKM
eukprot:gene12202-10512_t